MSARPRNRIGSPWLHFLLIGAVLFIGHTLSQEPAVPVIDGPTAERVALLRGEWLRTTGKLPSGAQLQTLIEQETDQTLLFEEALRHGLHLTDSVVVQRLLRDMRFIDSDLTDVDAELVIAAAIELGLHRNDPVVRRRLVQRMEQSAYASVRNIDPDDAVLRAAYNDNPTAWLKPAMVEFDHVFFSADRHADAAEKARSLAKEIQGHSFSEMEHRGDPFVHGHSFGLLTGQQVARYFGQSFTDELFSEQAKNASAPYGPVRSSYGEHLVWIKGLKAPAVKPFVEVRRDILREWRAQQEEQALAKQIAQLRGAYEIHP